MGIGTEVRSFWQGQLKEDESFIGLFPLAARLADAHNKLEKVTRRQPVSHTREDRYIMWAALALTTVLTAPAQTGELKLANKRSTVGIFGPKREDNKVLPGDLLVVAFDIENLTVRKDGRILYAMGLELTKKGKAKPEFKHDPEDKEAMNSLGGSTLPTFAMTLVGTDTPPGTYVLKVTVKDRGTKPVKTVTLEEEFEVLPLKFGLVQFKVTNGAGQPTPPLGVPGDTLWLHYTLVGYDMTRENPPNPDVTVEMQILDKETGKPTVEKPFGGRIKSGNKEFLLFSPTPIQLNRPGKFTIVLKATDNLSKKTSERRMDIEVLAPR